jgi:hypothetical protein
MKLIFSMLPLLMLASCIKIGPDYLDKEANLIDFTIRVEEADAYKEIRIYSKELKDGNLVKVDSTIFNALNKNGTNVTFPIGEGFVLGIEADSITLIKNGSFEAVAVKKDDSLVKKDFGKITNGVTKDSYSVYLRADGVVVE